LGRAIHQIEALRRAICLVLLIEGGEALSALHDVIETRSKALSIHLDPRESISEYRPWRYRLKAIVNQMDAALGMLRKTRLNAHELLTRIRGQFTEAHVKYWKHPLVMALDKDLTINRPHPEPEH